MKTGYKVKEFPVTAWMTTTSVGSLMLAASDDGLTCLTFASPQETPQVISGSHALVSRRAQTILQDAMRQVEEYLACARRQFDLPLDLAGPLAFNRRALEAAARIPYGQVITYGQLAAQAGNPRAARAAGAAMAHNPIAIIIPCHRVVDASMHLHGFGGPGGLKIKAWLLELEGLSVVNGFVKPAA